MSQSKFIDDATVYVELNFDNLTVLQMESIRDFSNWLELRRPSTRGADSQALEALHQLRKDWKKIHVKDGLERVEKIFGLLENA